MVFSVLLTYAPRVYIWLKYGELAENTKNINLYDYNGKSKYGKIWIEGLKDFYGEDQSIHPL